MIILNNFISSCRWTESIFSFLPPRSSGFDVKPCCFWAFPGTNCHPSSCSRVDVCSSNWKWQTHQRTHQPSSGIAVRNPAPPAGPADQRLPDIFKESFRSCFFSWRFNSLEMIPVRERIMRTNSDNGFHSSLLLLSAHVEGTDGEKLWLRNKNERPKIDTNTFETKLLFLWSLMWEKTRLLVTIL